MTLFDYILDSALVLIVVLQVKERPFTNRALIRPVVILAIAIANYLHGIPTAGNDLALAAVLCILGGAIGIASGATALMRVNPDGVLTLRSGWSSGFFWVLGMGSRFAFAWWAAHGGVSDIARFSIHHSITGNEAWTVALLGMAAFEVVGRTLTLAARRHWFTARVPARLALRAEIES